MGQNCFQIITGERRYLAARYLVQQNNENSSLGETVPCIVHAGTDLTEEERLRLQLIENIQREDLTPLEEARAYQRLIDEGNMSQAQLARELGVSRSILNETIRLLTLPEDFLKRLETMDEMPPKRELIKILREIGRASCRERV